MLDDKVLGFEYEGMAASLLGLCAHHLVEVGMESIAKCSHLKPPLLGRLRLLI
jgi:hypothetical protein